MLFKVLLRVYWSRIKIQESFMVLKAQDFSKKNDYESPPTTKKHLFYACLPLVARIGNISLDANHLSRRNQ